MKQENSPSVVVSEPNSSEASQSSTGEDVQRHWEGVVKRRAFLKGLGIASATQNGGAVATIKACTDDLLFHGQSSAFFTLVNRLAVEADSVRPGF